MATEKTLQTKIKLRYATLSEWTSADPTLLKGELALVEIPNVVNGIVQAPSVLAKIGTGDKKFSELDYMFAKSADIHSFLKVTEDEFKVWVKAATADAYDESGAAAKVEEALNAYIESNNAALATVEGKADKAQQEVDALELLVGTLPEDTTATSVVDYVNVKTAGIATDAALEEVNNQLTQAQKDIDAIEADYLKVQDRTDLETLINTEKERAEGIEAGLQSAIDTINNEETGILKQAQNYADGKDNAIAEAKKAGTDAQADLDAFKTTVADTYETKADATTKLTESKEHTNTEVAKVQTNVDNLSAKVGEVEEGKTVVELIEEAKQTAINGATYDDTEVRGLISDNSDAIAALTETHNADKAELQGNIDTVSGKVTTLIGDDANKSVRAIANEELAKQLITEDAAENLNTLEEIAAWIQSHPEDASAINVAIVALQNQLVGIDAGEGTVKKYVDDAITGANLNQYATNEKVNAIDERLETAEGEIDALQTAIATKVETSVVEALDTRMDAVEGAVATKAESTDLTSVSDRVTAIENDYLTSLDVLILDCGSAEGTA